MVGDIRKHLEKVPFAPFRIRMADGREYRVPTRDHIYLPPGPGRAIVADDDGYTLTLPALLISGIMEEPTAPERLPKPRRSRPPGSHGKR